LKVLGFKWVGCGAAGCNYEVTALIIVAMVVKPTIRKGLKYRTIFYGKISKKKFAIFFVAEFLAKFLEKLFWRRVFQPIRNEYFKPL